MPRPMLSQVTHTGTALPEIRSAAPARSQLSPQELERVLRRRRSTAYVEALAKLDAGGHVTDKSALVTLLDILRQELPEVTVEMLPEGIVAKCYLGVPFEVHTLDRVGQIIEHYRTTEPLPALLERARSLALHGDYAFVEVYATRLVAVKADGRTSVVEG